MGSAVVAIVGWWCRWAELAEWATSLVTSGPMLKHFTTVSNVRSNVSLCRNLCKVLNKNKIELKQLLKNHENLIRTLFVNVIGSQK